MNEITFRLASGGDDLPGLVVLYDAAARWMQANGIDQWQPGGKDEEHFRLRVRRGRGVARGGRRADRGCVRTVVAG